MIIMGYNSLNKLRDHEAILINIDEINALKV